MTEWTTTSLPLSSMPAASPPRIIGSWSAASACPRSAQTSWWLSEAAFTCTVTQPSGTSGSGRSPTSRPDSGSSADSLAAYAASTADALDPGHALASGRIRDRRGHGRPDPRVEHARDDAVVGQVVADDAGDGVGGRELHALGDPGGAHVECTSEHTGEGEHVVDLVGEVAAAGGHHPGVLATDVRMDLRVGV